MPLSEIGTVIKNNLIPTLIDYEYAEKLNSLSQVIKCYIKIDMGINRFGFKINEMKKLRNCFTFKNLKIEGIYFHLFDNDAFDKDKNNYYKNQIDNFNYIITILKEDNIRLKYLINSFTILNYKEHKNINGLLMYRISPFPYYKELELLKKYKLRPIASLKCKIILIKIIKKGDKVGYNSKYIANTKTKIAIISIGYADGLSFSSSKNKLNVNVNGISCPIIGNICMDCTIIKIPLDCDIKVGDIVTLFENNIYEDEYNNMKEYFLKTDSPIGEIFSRLGSRITRIYHL